jgi:hypothetical protein
MSKVYLSAQEQKMLFDKIEQGRSEHIYVEAIYRNKAFQQAKKDRNGRYNSRTRVSALH